MITAWSHLPNAVHIDRVIASIPTELSKWSVTNELIERMVETSNRKDLWKNTSITNTLTNNDAAWNAIWAEIKDLVNKQNNIIHGIGLAKARGALWDALAALMAWDDCAYMLDSEPGELAIIAALGDERAIMLLPACLVFSKERLE